MQCRPHRFISNVQNFMMLTSDDNTFRKEVYLCKINNSTQDDSSANVNTNINTGWALKYALAHDCAARCDYNMNNATLFGSGAAIFPY